MRQRSESEALLEGLLQDLDKVLTDEQIAHLRIQEIGEKRGRLDVVFDCPDWLRETVQDSVSNAVMESEHVCILCSGRAIWSPNGDPCPICLARRSGPRVVGAEP